MFQIQTFWHHPMYPDSSYTTNWMLLWIWPRLPSSIWQFLGFLQYWVVGHILTQNNCTNWINFSKQYNSSGLVCLLFGDFRISMFLFAQRLRIYLSESSKPHPFFLISFYYHFKVRKTNCTDHMHMRHNEFFFNLCKLDFINYTLVIYLMYHVVQFQIFSPKLKFSLKHIWDARINMINYIFLMSGKRTKDYRNVCLIY